MKRLISCLLAVLIVFSLAACQAPTELDPTNPPGGNGASKPTSKEPPMLKIMDSTCMDLEATKGTYSWTYDNGDGTMSGVCADSSHSLEWKEYLVPMTTADDTVELYFDVAAPILHGPLLERCLLGPGGRQGGGGFHRG